MPSSPSATARFAVIGGGITGLAAAYRLTRLRPDAAIELFEASERLGGVLDTRRLGEALVERGADSFLNTQPWATELCQELGLAGELIPTNPGHRRALVVREGRSWPVPEGFVVIRPHRMGPLLRSPLLSWSGKLRVLCEPWIATPARATQPGYDESVASFATRRLGREAFEWLVEPLLAGIYTADAAKLSMAATMSEALAAEREHGSLVRASRGTVSTDSGARYANFVALRGGLSRLIESLAAQLPRDLIRLVSPISHISPAADHTWCLSTASGNSLGPYDGLILAVPAPRAAEITAVLDPKLSGLLHCIPYASSAVVSLLLKREDVCRLPDGFGLVVPAVENRPIVAASFSSVKFTGRAPDSCLLVRVFLGGALRPEQLERDDDALRDLAIDQMRQLLGFCGEPLVCDVVRWREKMPQYHVGHVQLVAAIEERVARHVGLELAGNAYHGVGIPQCIRSANLAAERLVKQLVAP